MRLAPILAAALLASVSCADSTAPVIALTDAEVAQLFAEIASASGDIATGPAGASAGASAGSTVTMTTTVDCLGGGTVELNGSATENNSTSLSLDVTETFIACKTETFTVGGSLRLLATISAPSETAITMHATMRGGFDVIHEDGRTGACIINVTMDLSVDGENVGVTVNGTVCGRDARFLASSVAEQ